MEAAVYVDHVKELLHCPAKESYDRLLSDKEKVWSQAFAIYYKGNIDGNIGINLGRVLLESLGCYDSKSGVTQNSSESINASSATRVARSSFGYMPPHALSPPGILHQYHETGDGRSR